MLKLDKLACSYQQQLMQFSLEVKQGEKIAILGPSGAGKSTLLNLIAGFIDAEQGSLWIQGVDCTTLAPAKRPVSMLFQENNLFTHLTVYQNLGLGLHPGLRLNSVQKSAIQRLAERTGLDDLLTRYPHQLSGGQRQRVALTRCLLRQRPILLLDEPFSALDPALRQEMLQLTEELCQEHQLTLLMVSHNLDDARLIADRCAIVDNGRVHWLGDTEQLFSGSVLQAAVLGVLKQTS